MADRTQINIRIDNELVEAIKARCEEENSTQTEFIVAAIRNALGMPSSTDSTDLNELVDAKLAALEQRLSERIAALEEERQGATKKIRRVA